jgi:hypothetical protein
VLTKLAEEAPTAGGAALDEVMIAGLMALAFMVPFAWTTLRERTGHTTLLGRLADAVAKVDGLPRWVGLPYYLATVSLLSCGFGVWWDVPIHMQNGRDEGPLANPSHYFIFLGILGFLHAGILSMALARGPLPRRTIRLSRSWRAPLGALPMIGAGLIATVGFPADDVWHRLFGQDVTEWGPTHVMMIGGAVTWGLAGPLLMAEARQVGAPGALTRAFRWKMGFALAFCMVPIAFLMEFDLGVPQFPLVTQYVIFGFLLAWIACACRIWMGPGGALFTAALYLLIHAFLYYSIAIPLPDVLNARFLLWVPGAILVELVALALDPRRKPLPFALGSGLAVGTLGLFAEWGWAHWFMPLPQPTDAQHLPFLLGAGTIAAIGGALLATWHVARIREVSQDPEQLTAATVDGDHEGFRRHWAGATGIVLFIGLMAVFAPPQEIDSTATATVEYADVVRGGDLDCIGGEEICEVNLRVTVSDPELVEDALWFYGLAWQGRGPGGVRPDVSVDPQGGEAGVVRVALEETGERGVYRTADPLPLYGSWKVLLRLHTVPSGHAAFPVYAPDDPAIESERGRQVLREDGEAVELEFEKHFLQREQRDDVPSWLFTAGYAVVNLCWFALLGFYGWCYAAAARGARVHTRGRDSVTA